MTRTDDATAHLPVRTALPALTTALDEHGTAVLCAPPGTGKTTLVPLVLAGLTGGDPVRRVLVAEPRRIAARAAARRMAWLLGEEPGGRVGFTVRGERKAGPRTVVEVVTTGVLLQRLQRDPELAGVDVVVLDECHERHLDADTAAAFLLDVRAALRPGLRLVAASATTDAEGWARLLGGAPVVTAHSTAHPVEVVWAPPPRAVRPPHGLRVDPVLLDHVAAVVRRALHEREGDVLCFLPGVGEIGRVAGALGSPERLGAEVLQVHGRAPAAVQEAVLAGGAPGTRRVVLATAVAESSLTVPGVRVVVDAGLAREPRTDHARGLSALTTVRASRAAGRQRAGRAGREAPGTVYRCWAEGDEARLPAFPAAEITVADLTAFALQAACWGDPDAGGLALLDPPPAGAMAAARAALTATGAVDEAGRPTERGRRMARLGVHPRLARALLDGAPRLGARRAAEVVALLSEEPPREYGDDLAGAWRAARRGADAYGARWRAEARRLEGALRGVAEDGPHPGDAPLTDDAAAGLVAALAFPERIACSRGGSAYLMVSGTGAELGDGSRLRGMPWLAVAVADRPVAAASARVRLGAVIDEETARATAGALLTEGEEVRWSAERRDVVARRVARLGAVELSSARLAAPDRTRLRAALLEGLAAEGPELLRWSAEATGLRQRLAFLRRELGDPWPDVSDAALLARAEEWLGPELDRARGRAGLERADARACLERLLPWASGDAARLGELAPERIEVPSGSRIRVDYGDGQPVLAVKLQELFGLRHTPLVAGGRVPVLVHLLSPAGRPAAVTADLASFWRDGYRAVRAELRGRYPRHPWPEDPTTAEATRRTNTRRR
ncbi:ATP-dependent helicase HrpB [Streptomyces sp. AV19]|uniref:ATP-dependent helicase HrpB n=1 Tax=Streptomyces sp. AV19 TaxID=2793068 RepID=UPI0018FE1D69|nr:ATP-dependent helicase HrpB [Streptomyces sp. AV19]MBH1936344.1 ATP-dependent helicase HrpB [Streptomyces sp. AV19]MDG4532381.1 ATP-dependent helicase HrpB [Streptomyces sp. AV19]